MDKDRTKLMKMTHYMKKTVILALCAATVLLGQSCSKAPKIGINDASKKYLDAWIKVNHPEAKKVSPGVYILSETPGNGVLAGSVEDHYYVRIEYTTRDLKGNILKTTNARTAQQIGTYDKTAYYGPEILYRGIASKNSFNIQAGMEALLRNMNEGGSVSAIVPGWFATYERYGSEEEYISTVSGEDGIYDIKLVDAISDVIAWEIDSVARYAAAHDFPDSLKYGFYYKQLVPPTDNSNLSTGTVININYTGRRLDGQVFDTTIKDTAKVHNIYKPSSSYSTTQMYIDADDYKNIKMGSSSDGSDVVDGFALLVSQMKVGEKGIALFYSGRGYEDSGSGNLIPGFCPLIFEVEVTGKKE